MAISRKTYAAIRYGYGFAPGEDGPADGDALLAQLSAAKGQVPAFLKDGAAAHLKQGIDLKVQINTADEGIREGTVDPQYKKPLIDQRNALFLTDLMERVLQAVQSPYGFHERLVAFWFDHFSISAMKNDATRFLTPLFEAEAIRPNISGRFVDLLLAAENHPGMLTFLDQDKSAGPSSEAARKRRIGLNENLGRELIELHTMGARSGYTQSDVRNAALVLTGMTVDKGRDFSAVFRPALAQPGEKVVLGKNYGGNGISQADSHAMITDLAGRPETALHICRKLVTHFIADTPPDEVVKPMLAAWKKTDGDLTAVYAAMLDHPRAWDGFGQKIKRPFDFIVSGLRAVNAGTTLQSTLPVVDMVTQDKTAKTMRDMTDGAMRRMGQPIWKPPSPAGFDEHGDAWLTPAQLAERINWARRAAALAQVKEPVALAQDVLGDVARPDTLQVIGRAPNRMQGIAMVLASAEFNRR
ncbi:MAG: DUF1800 domain-containing protein [Proteobacteria bacterium]|nr:DUF1800 domain-containing protein [Pseudomonadota bacterium]